MTDAAAILSLKGTLVYCLKQALFSTHEEDRLDFTNLSYTGHAQRFDLSQATPDYLLLKPPHNTVIPLSSGDASIFPLADRSLQIPLQKKRNSDAILYTSALPQRLLSSRLFDRSLTLLDISWLISNRLQKVMFESMHCELDHNTCNVSSIPQVWNEFEIETHRPGWIAFRLSQVGIRRWLEHCLNQYDIGIVLHDKLLLMHATYQKRNPVSDEIMWQLQYAHAHCCRLLRLWQQVSAESKSDLASQHWLRDSLCDFPQKEAGLQAEQNKYQVRLVHSLIEMTDHMFWIPYQWHSKQYFLLLEHAALLCQALEQFCAGSLIGLSDVAHSDVIALVSAFQAKFHLISMSQKTLELLLTRYLQAEAPTVL